MSWRRIIMCPFGRHRPVWVISEVVPLPANPLVIEGNTAGHVTLYEAVTSERRCRDCATPLPLFRWPV